MLHILETAGIILLIVLCLFVACVWVASWVLGANFSNTIRWHRRKP